MLRVVERDGEVCAAVVKDTTATTVHEMVRGDVENGATLMSDEHVSFVDLSDGYHSAGEYMRHYPIHTDTIEGV